MQNFDYQTPTRLIFGKGVVEKLPKVMGRFGKKILLTYGGGSIKKIGLYQKVKELLKDFDIVELAGIQPNHKYNPSVLDGVSLCKIRYQFFRNRFFVGQICNSQNAIEATYKFFESIGIPMHLRKVGIDESRIDEMAHHIAVNEGLENAYAPLTEQDIKKILIASL
ncbi:MAG: iron-containing alcohol dehydrogenase [Bacteroidales bacterium]|nr:iron-containing alcohol dehydrogenase [Bacteroidales bacterium]